MVCVRNPHLLPECRAAAEAKAKTAVEQPAGNAVAKSGCQLINAYRGARSWVKE